MTEQRDWTNVDLPQAVVAAPPAVFDLLASCGASWDVGHRAMTLGHMWQELSSGQMPTTASIVILSDSLLDSVDLPQAASTMATAPVLTVVCIANLEDTDSIISRVESACSLVPDADVSRIVFVPAHDPLMLLDRIRAVCDRYVSFPAQWPQSAIDAFHNYNDNDDVFVPADIETPPVEVISAPSPSPSPRRQPVRSTYAPPELPQLGTAKNARPVMPVVLHPRPNQRTYTSMSAKGGVGKTTTALGLAATISAAAKAAGNPLRVCVVDLDIETGQIGAAVGECAPTAYGLFQEPIKDPQTVERYVKYVPSIDIEVLLAPVNPLDATKLTPEFYRHVIRVLKNLFDVVILDTSTRYTDPLIAEVCAPESHGIWFITDMDKKTVRLMQIATSVMLEVKEYGGGPIPKSKMGIIVNKCRAGMGMTAELIKQASNNVAIVGSVPADDGATTKATNFGELDRLLDDTRLAPAWYALAKTMLNGTGHPIAPATAAMGGHAQDTPHSSVIATGASSVYETTVNVTEDRPPEQAQPNGQDDLVPQRRGLLARFRSS